MRGLVLALGQVLLPGDCGACALPGRPICSACLAALRRPRPPWCDGCGHPWPATSEVSRCAECLGRPLRARHALAYEGPVPALVAAFKDGGRRSLAGPLAALVTESVARPADGWALVPVPAGRAGRRRRGYDQAELLARRLGSSWGLPVESCLRRSGDGPAQRGASRTDRIRQVVGAFRVTSLPPVRAVLVDDVHTTGATLAACARVLRRAGCRDVTAICLARVWAS